MLSRLPIRLFALVLLALTGCDWGSTEPVSLSVQFVAAHRPNPDGSCTVQFVAQASGFGSAQWERVVIRRGGAVIEEFVGAQTAQFWGEPAISAGEQQASAPFQAPDAGAGVQVDVSYRITGPERIANLTVPSCTSS